MPELLLSPGINTESDRAQIPANFGGSLSIIDSLQAALAQERFVRPSIRHGHEYVLPAYSTRPIDEVSGLPYCIIPSSELPPIPNGANCNRLADWDHQFPKVETKHGANPVLELPYARSALMNLRLQWLLFEDHHDEWNKCQSVGPMQPGTPQQLAATLLLGLCGDMPSVGLALKGRKYVEEMLSDEDRHYMWESGQLRVGNESSVAAYLRWYALSQELDHIRQTEIEEFLHTFDKERRMYLGHLLAALIAERAVEPMEDAYNRARKEARLKIWSPARKTLVPAPANPRDLLKGHITRGKRFGPMLNEMTRRLARYHRADVRPAA